MEPPRGKHRSNYNNLSGWILTLPGRLQSSDKSQRNVSQAHKLTSTQWCKSCDRISICKVSMEDIFVHKWTLIWWFFFFFFLPYFPEMCWTVQVVVWHPTSLWWILIGSLTVGGALFLVLSPLSLPFMLIIQWQPFISSCCCIWVQVYKCPLRNDHINVLEMF